MKNAECTVYIGTRSGRMWTYQRDKDGWTQTGPTGKVRRMTAEQLLSHLLPPLAGVSPAVVRVEPGRPRQKHEPSSRPANCADSVSASPATACTRFRAT